MSGAAASLAVVAAACSNVDQVICLQVQQSPEVGKLTSPLQNLLRFPARDEPGNASLTCALVLCYPGH